MNIQNQESLEFDFLGVLIKNPALMDSVQVIWSFEKPFVDDRLNMIWHCMKDVYVNTGKLSNLGLRRNIQKNYETLDLSVINKISGSGAFPEQLPEFLTEIKSRMIIRNLQNLGHVFTNTDIAADGMRLLELASQKVRDIEQGMTFKTKFTVSETIQKVIEKANRVVNNPSKFDYIRTGFQELDRLIVGFQIGKMYVIAARPSVGKTAFALSMLGNMESFGIECGFLSCEMDEDSLLERRVQQISGISMNDLAQKRNKEELIQFQQAGQLYKQQTKSVFECVSDDRRLANVKLQMRNMVKKSRPKKDSPGIKVMFVDYLQKIKPDKKGHNLVAEIGEICGDLTDMGKELDCVVALLAQLKRDSDGRAPVMGDLKGSSDIEQDADGIFLIDRDKNNHSETQECKLIACKVRDAGIGIVNCKFTKKTTLFHDRLTIEENEHEF